MRLRHTSARLVAPVFCLILACVTSADADHHEAASWDQEQAAAAATELAAALDGLRDALRSGPDPSIAPGGGARQRHRLRDRLRLMENEAKHLAKELADGQGRDETLPVFQRIDEIRRDAVDDAQRTFLTQPVTDKIAAGRAPLEKLAALYGVALKGQYQER